LGKDIGIFSQRIGQGIGFWLGIQALLRIVKSRKARENSARLCLPALLNVTLLASELDKAARAKVTDQLRIFLIEMSIVYLSRIIMWSNWVDSGLIKARYRASAIKKLKQTKERNTRRNTRRLALERVATRSLKC
jgi:hypothetical protein